MEKIVKKLIDDSLNGVDVYYHNGSIWFIFTETKQWVLEIEKSGNLWYSYSFFKNLFNYLSMDVVESQEYITRYVEDVLQNGVKATYFNIQGKLFLVEDVLQNGVKATFGKTDGKVVIVEDVLQNGVKNTKHVFYQKSYTVEDVLQNGLKSININTGIKEVKELPDMSGELRGYGDYYRKQKDRAKPHVLYVKDAIEKGLKLK